MKSSRFCVCFPLETKNVGYTIRLCLDSFYYQNQGLHVFSVLPCVYSLQNELQR